MKLYNNTKLDDKILYKVLYMAAKAVGSIRTQGVVVKITRAHNGCSGHCRRRGWGYYEWFLKSQKYPGPARGMVIFSDGGFMFLRLLVAPRYGIDPLATAERIYKLAAHEWRHIRDFQKKERFCQYERNWANRPHERRAMNSEKRAERIKMERPDIQEAIIALGINLEQLRKDRCK